MTQVTQILSQIEQGDGAAAEQLLPLVYEELRRLAKQKLNHESPGQTLQATALVHEAYLRLVNVEEVQHWDCRGHFFAAAAEAMRRILVENARRKQRTKHGGDYQRLDLQEIEVGTDEPAESLLALHEALDAFAVADPIKADLIKLRYFAGLTLEQAAEALGISRATAVRYWTYGRAWLYDRIEKSAKD